MSSYFRLSRCNVPGCPLNEGSSVPRSLKEASIDVRSEPLSPIESPALMERLQGLAGSAAPATREAPAMTVRIVRICIERNFMLRSLINLRRETVRVSADCKLTQGPCGVAEHV